MAEPELTIRLFGSLCVLVPGRSPLTFPPGPTGALLAYLVLNGKHGRTREELIALLWPEDEPETARHKLRNTLYTLRRQLEQPPNARGSLLLTTRTTVQIDPARVRTDVAAFEEAVRAAARTTGPAERIRLLSRAIDQYRGDLLPGFYQDFFVAEQRRLAEAHRGALHALVLAYEQAGELDHAVECARSAIALNPLMEEAHCDLMRLYAALGQPSAVVRQYQELERILAEQLGEAPSESTRQLLQALRQNGHTTSAARTVPVPKPGRSAEVPADTRFPPVPQRTPRPYVFLAMAGAAALVLLLFRLLTVPRPPSPGSGPAPPTAPTGRELWVRRFPTRPGDKDSEPTAMTADSSGNIYVTGFVQTTDHDVDYLTLKYDPDGKLLWQARYNGPGNDVDRARAIAVDRAGNVYVTGESDNGKGNGKSRLSGLDYATVKYDAGGRRLWVRRFNGAVNGDDRAVQIGLDAAGNVYVTGTSEFYDGRWHKQMSAIVTIKYDADGNRQWQQSFGVEGNICGGTPADMAVDGAGNVYVTGYSYVMSSFLYRVDYVTFRYDTQGKLHWVRLYHGVANGQNFARKIVLNRSGDVYVTGAGYNGDVANGGTEMDCVTLMYNANGDQQWVRSFDWGHGGDNPRGLAVDRSGNVFIASESGGQTGLDYVTVKYDTNATERWAKHYNGLASFDDTPCALALDSAGNVFVTGTAYNGHPNDHGTDRDYATLKYDTNGNLLWLRTYNGPVNSTDSARALVVDATGCAIVTGQSNGGKTNDIVTIKYSP